MKKAFLLAVLVLSSATLFAQHPGSTGLGIVVGSNVGLSDFGANAGFSYKNPSIPVFWALYLEFSNDFLSLGLTGDTYIIDKPIVNDNTLHLDWYLGLGAFASAGSYKDDFYFGAGARAPIGLSWYIVPQAELFLAVAPSLGIDLSPKLYFPNFFLSGELGFRYWLH